MGSRSVICQVPGREPRTFTFDNVLFGPQTEVFEGALLGNPWFLGIHPAIIQTKAFRAGCDSGPPGVSAPLLVPYEAYGAALRCREGASAHGSKHILTQNSLLFAVAGMPMVDNCMSGYNSSIFAYGQTGAGKTHTMLGQIDKSKPQTEVRGGAPVRKAARYWCIGMHPGVNKIVGLPLSRWELPILT